jgi:hypothetical protein
MFSGVVQCHNERNFKTVIPGLSRVRVYLLEVS